jgi:hypothetical protein
MSEAQNGSALLAGNPASDGAAGQGSAQAASTPAIPGIPEGAVSSNAQLPTGQWYDNISDPDLKGYVQNKAWADPGELANGYRNLEKLLGGEKLPMPKGDDDAEGWNRVYDSLGRPKTADDYKLPVPEGASPEFTKEASAKFHELGINTKQAQALAEWYSGKSTAAMEQMNLQSSQASESDVNELKQTWGSAFNENLELGRRAAREFGLDNTQLTKIEGALGTKGLLEFMSKVGRGLTEHGFEGGKSTNSFGMTPEAAQSRINALRNDQEWSGKYLSGNADAKSEMERLMRLAYPDA